MSRVDDLIASSRARRALEDDRFECAWDGVRAMRTREGVLRRRDQRVRRGRALRRGLAVAAGAGLLLVALLRAASSAPGELGVPIAGSLTIATGRAPGAPGTMAPTPQERRPPSAEPSTLPSDALALRALADAGYARD